MQSAVLSRSKGLDLRKHVVSLTRKAQPSHPLTIIAYTNSQNSHESKQDRDELVVRDEIDLNPRHVGADHTQTAARQFGVCALVVGLQKVPKYLLPGVFSSGCSKEQRKSLSSNAPKTN